MRFIRWTTFVFLFSSIIGCDNSPIDPVTSEATDSEMIDVVEQPVVQVDIKSWEEIQSWVADQRGKVVVVDVWSTSCLPCVQEFPHFVELHEELAGDVACASLNIDYYGGEDETPEDIKPRVLKFLTNQRASMQNFVSSDADEDVYKQISTAAIPASLVYDRGGKLHTTFNNDEGLYGEEGFNYADDIKPLVMQLLESDGS